MAHGYYNLKGEFVTTASREEATNAWRKERGYSTGGVYDMGGGDVVDTRSAARPTPATPAPPPPTAFKWMRISSTWYARSEEIAIATAPTPVALVTCLMVYAASTDAPSSIGT